MNNLAVSEQFFSIQGEGPSAGTPALFLRCRGCNLLCGQTREYDPACTWRCDTIDVWKKGALWSIPELVSVWEKKGWLNALESTAHLVVTGGEPLLQQSALMHLFKALKKRVQKDVFIEIETNGTVMPNKELLSMISQCNVSPKLSNSGITLDQRIKPAVILAFRNEASTIFKIVINSEQDLTELRKTLIEPYGIAANKVFLMPGQDNAKQYLKYEKQIKQYCQYYNFEFSPRLQITHWDKAVGV